MGHFKKDCSNKKQGNGSSNSTNVPKGDSNFGNGDMLSVSYFGFVLMDNDPSCKVIGMGSIKFKMFNHVVWTLEDVSMYQS